MNGDFGTAMVLGALMARDKAKPEDVGRIALTAGMAGLPNGLVFAKAMTDQAVADRRGRETGTAAAGIAPGASGPPPGPAPPPNDSAMLGEMQKQTAALEKSTQALASASVEIKSAGKLLEESTKLLEGAAKAMASKLTAR